MGKVFSVVKGNVSKHLGKFNIDNRAQRVIEQHAKNPIAAPKYKSSVADYLRVLDEDPEFVRNQGVKNTGLDQRLKEVYVTSETHTISQPDDPNRPLPLSRDTVDDYEYGYKEPEKVTRGKTTLRQAIVFIGEHQTDPTVWTATKISTDYQLKQSTVEHILKYYSNLNIHIPDHPVRGKHIQQQLRSPLNPKNISFNKMLEELTPPKKPPA